MKREYTRWFRIFIITLIVLLLIIGCEYTSETKATAPVMPQASQQPTLKKTTPTSNPTPIPFDTKFAWFYKPPENIELLPQNFDLFILTHKDEEERDQLQAMGVSAPIYQYLLLAEIREPESCDDVPFGNQVAYHIGDFCWISAEHPDWFLLDQFGNRIGTKNGTYHMDPGNQGYREFWLSRAKEMQIKFGWEGIFIDNAEGSIFKFIKKGALPKNYPNNSSYQIAVEGFLAYLRQSYFEPNGRPMYANIVSTESNTVWQSYSQYLDGVMIEAFAVDWSTGYQSTKSWEAQIALAEGALSQGKKLILVSQGDKLDTKRQLFAYTSYLLVTNGNAAFRYANADSYNQIWLYDNYLIDLGSPLNSRYKYGLSWRRDFENGYVIVNPSTHTGKIIVD